MFTNSWLRHGLTGVTCAVFLAFAPASFARDRWEDDCDDECSQSVVRPPLCYSVCRHLKLHSVYTWRKITRPYRRIAGIPPQLAPYAAPSLPPNPYVNPYGPGGAGFEDAYGSGSGFAPVEGGVRYNPPAFTAQSGNAVISHP